jgi:hypothetical protein
VIVQFAGFLLALVVSKTTRGSPAGVFLHLGRQP